MSDIDFLLLAEQAAADSVDEAQKVREGRLALMLGACNDKQRPVLLDFDSGTKYISVRCPRRSGKSFIMALLCCYIGEKYPGSRILIISLTLKSTKENYWTASPSGIFTMSRLFGLELKPHHTDLTWTHENGSRGRLAGAETRADIEYLRGAAAEADVVILDECKSFAPGLLNELIYEVLEPGLMTRDGVIVMGGTPGLIPVGPFYEATCESARNEVGEPTCVPYGQMVRMAASFINEDGEEEATDDPWSLHTWTVQDNTAVPKQWLRALRIKRRRGWSDDHPTWRREYLGEWVMDGEGLVYAYAGVKASDPDKVTWNPSPKGDNKAGLPPEEGPWHLIFGLDLGFEDDTALVVVAYSERLAELRHVYDFKQTHMLPPEIVELIEGTMARYGMPVAVVGDAGNLGKMLVEWFNTMGIPMVKAEKVEKNDHIELLNGDFHTGRIKLIPGSDMENEICGLQWDLSDGGKQELARKGKLREDSRLPNHLCDALLYAWRFSYHHFARAEAPKLVPGSPEWTKAQLKKAEARRAGIGKEARQFIGDGYPGIKNQTNLTRDTLRWQMAARTVRPSN